MGDQALSDRRSGQGRPDAPESLIYESPTGASEASEEGVTCEEIAALLGRGGSAIGGDSNSSMNMDLLGVRGTGAASLRIRDSGEVATVTEALAMLPDVVSQIERPAEPPRASDSLALGQRAEVLRKAGHLQEAERCYLQMIELLDHEDDTEALAASLNNLSVIYATTGDFHRARTHQQRALMLIEKTCGIDDSKVATCLNNLAEIYRKQGLLLEVEVLYERSLEIRRKAVGPNHPDVAVSLNNLAELYREQGCLDDAEVLFEQALKIILDNRGEHDPDVATVLNNLGLIAVARGNEEVADRLYSEALAIQRQAFGDYHLSVATTLNNLGLLRKAQGKYHDAERNYRRAYEIESSLLGPGHPNLALYLSNLAALREEQGDQKAAREHYAAALEIFGVDLGPSYPMVLSLLEEMQEFYLRHGWREDAARIGRRLDNTRSQLEQQIYGV